MKTEKKQNQSTKIDNKLQEKSLPTHNIKTHNRLINDLAGNIKNIKDFKDAEQFKKTFQKNYDLMSHEEKICLKSKLSLDKTKIEKFNTLFIPNIKTAILLEMRHFFRKCLNECDNLKKKSISSNVTNELKYITEKCRSIHAHSDKNNPASLALSELNEIYARNPKASDLKTIEKFGQFYMTKEQRKDFEINLSSDGVLRQRQKPVVANKKVYAVRYITENQVTKPVLCMASRNETLPQEQRLGWSHSCFFAGAAVAGAGEISTNKSGQVIHIDNNTGHYQVNPILLAKTIIILEKFLANNLNIEFSSTFYTKGMRTFATDKSLECISKDTALLWAEIMLNIQKKVQPLIYSLNHQNCKLSIQRKKEIFLKQKDNLYKNADEKITKTRIDKKEKVILLKTIEKSFSCWQKEFDLRQSSTCNIDSNYYPILWEK